jgi:sulfoxide reductase catalytic subunit YedY
MPPVLEEQRSLERREILAALGLGSFLAALPRSAIAACQEGSGAKSKVVEAPESYSPSTKWVPKWAPPGGADRYPAPRNDAFHGGRSLTPEDGAARKNNYYEFLSGRAGEVYRYVDKFEARPWKVVIAGEVEEPKTVDVDEIAKIAPLEERIYRHRCVEAWSMVVPWTGLPLSAFVKWCKPKADARFLKFTSFHRPEQAPGQKESSSYPWPYYEGLRLDEALSPLALIVTGIYGHGLPVQHGAPLRIAVPWKYGYKSPKGIVKVEFTKDQPGTFWSDMQPTEYPFLSNVDGSVPHPRWSQEYETDIATGDKIKTQKYNGYGNLVEALYRP